MIVRVQDIPQWPENEWFWVQRSIENPEWNCSVRGSIFRENWSWNLLEACTRCIKFSVKKSGYEYLLYSYVMFENNVSQPEVIFSCNYLYLFRKWTLYGSVRRSVKLRLISKTRTLPMNLSNRFYRKRNSTQNDLIPTFSIYFHT